MKKTKQTQVNALQDLAQSFGAAHHTLKASANLYDKVFRLAAKKAEFKHYSNRAEKSLAALEYGDKNAAALTLIKLKIEFEEKGGTPAKKSDRLSKLENSKAKEDMYVTMIRKVDTALKSF